MTRQIYLGTAEDILRYVNEAREHREPKELRSRQFGLPVALFQVAERIGLRDIVNKVVPGNVKNLSIGDYLLIAVINRVGNHDRKANEKNVFEEGSEGFREKALQQVLLEGLR